MSKYRVDLIDTSGNHAYMYPEQFLPADTLKEAIEIFVDWLDEVERYAERSCAMGRIYVEDCDYPEFLLEIGPRGGIRRIPA